VVLTEIGVGCRLSAVPDSDFARVSEGRGAWEGGVFIGMRRRNRNIINWIDSG
jgi:hypothetical protein